MKYYRIDTPEPIYDMRYDPCIDGEYVEDVMYYGCRVGKKKKRIVNNE